MITQMDQCVCTVFCMHSGIICSLEIKSVLQDLLLTGTHHGIKPDRYINLKHLSHCCPISLIILSNKYNARYQHLTCSSNHGEPFGVVYCHKNNQVAK